MVNVHLYHELSAFDISVRPVYGGSVKIDIWRNHTYSQLFQTTLKDAMSIYDDDECATIPSEITSSEKMMFFYHKRFYRDMKINIIGHNLLCSPDACKHSSVVVLLDTNMHPERCANSRNPFCGVPVPCEFQLKREWDGKDKCIYLCKCILPTGENVCPGEQRIAIAIGPAATEEIKPMKLCGLTAY